MLRWFGLGLFVVVVLGGGWLYLDWTHRSGPIDPSLVCYIGAYEFGDRSAAVVVASENPETLWLVLPDGSRGTLQALGEPGRFGGDHITFERGDCRTPQATFRFALSGGSEAARKLEFVERYVRFSGGDVELAGKLVLPASGSVKQIVVWVTGSNDAGEVDRTHWQYTLPLHGIGSFVFDKRGSGGSSGSASANFYVRAADVRAAVAEVRRLTANAPVEIGLHGASQGGWVAPLAGLDANVDFVIVSYGLAEGVTAEDRDEMAVHSRQAGYGADVGSKVRVLTDLTAEIVKSHWQEGWADLAEWRAAHGDEPWVQSLPATSYTGALLQIPSFVAAIIGPVLGPLMDQGVSFEYEPQSTLETLDVPQLWILGGKDTSAPSAATIQILRELQSRGVALDLVVFPQADHGIIEPWPGSDHAQERISPGYRELVAEWSRTRLVQIAVGCGHNNADGLSMACVRLQTPEIVR